MAAPLITNIDRVRITRVDRCGRPVCGDGNAWVTYCHASVAMEPNVTEGTDIEFTAGNGQSCGFKRGCPTLNGFDVTYTFFQAAPELIEMMTGQPVFYDHAGEPIGWSDESVACRAGFALEAWAEPVGEDVCPEDDAGDGIWLYFLLPWVTNGLLGGVTLGNEGVNFELTGATRAGGRWGEGPYDVMAQDASGTPGPMLTPIGQRQHRRSFLTTIEPPEPATEALPVEGEMCEVSP